MGLEFDRRVSCVDEMNVGQENFFTMGPDTENFVNETPSRVEGEVDLERILDSSMCMEMIEYDGAILVPIAVPEIWRYLEKIGGTPRQLHQGDGFP